MGNHRGRLVALLVILVSIGACTESDMALDRRSAPEEPDSSVPSSAGDLTPEESTTFADPQGEYLMDIDPTWVDQHGSFIAEVEVWIVGRTSVEFAPNVNVIAQTTPGLSLEEYTDLSIDQLPALIGDVELIDQSTVDGPSTELGLIEYTAAQQGLDLHFLQTYFVEGTTAVVATLSTRSEDFAELRAEVEPYLLSLRPATD